MANKQEPTQHEAQRDVCDDDDERGPRRFRSQSIDEEPQKRDPDDVLSNVNQRETECSPNLEGNPEYEAALEQVADRHAAHVGYGIRRRVG